MWGTWGIGGKKINKGLIERLLTKALEAGPSRAPKRQKPDLRSGRKTTGNKEVRNPGTVAAHDHFLLIQRVRGGHRQG